MEAGKLRHRVKIQQFTRVSDGMGGYTETWADVATVWGSVEPLQGQELYQAQQLQTNQTHRIRIRYRQGLDTSMRVVFGSRIFLIQAIIDLNERHREIHLLCQEV